jgi:hypothetical protein
MVLPGSKILRVGAKDYMVRETELSLQRDEERFVEVVLEEIPFKSWFEGEGRGMIQSFGVREVFEPPDIYDENQTHDQEMADDNALFEVQRDEQEMLECPAQQDETKTFANVSGNGGCSLQSRHSFLPLVLLTLAILCALSSLKRGGRTPRS